MTGGVVDSAGEVLEAACGVLEADDELSDSGRFLGRPGRDAAFRGGRPAFGTGLKNARMSFEEDISHPADQGDDLEPIDQRLMELVSEIDGLCWLLVVVSTTTNFEILKILKKLIY